MANHPHLWLHHNYFFLKSLQRPKKYIKKFKRNWRAPYQEEEIFPLHKRQMFHCLKCLAYFFSVIPVDKFSTGTFCWVTLQSSSNVTLLKMRVHLRCLMTKDLEKWPSKRVVPGLWSTRMQTYDMIKTIMGAHLRFWWRRSVVVVVSFFPNFVE
jgi:hypothetical protein